MTISLASTGHQSWRFTVGPETYTDHGGIDECMMRAQRKRHELMGTDRLNIDMTTKANDIKTEDIPRLLKALENLKKIRAEAAEVAERVRL